MHAKYQVAMRNIVKVIANVNVGANQPTDQQTDRAKTICPQYILVDIKIAHYDNFKQDTFNMVLKLLQEKKLCLKLPEVHALTCGIPVSETS